MKYSKLVIIGWILTIGSFLVYYGLAMLAISGWTISIVLVFMVVCASIPGYVLLIYAKILAQKTRDASKKQNDDEKKKW